MRPVRLLAALALTAPCVGCNIFGVLLSIEGMACVDQDDCPSWYPCIDGVCRWPDSGVPVDAAGPEPPWFTPDRTSSDRGWPTDARSDAPLADAASSDLGLSEASTWEAGPGDASEQDLGPAPDAASLGDVDGTDVITEDACLQDASIEDSAVEDSAVEDGAVEDSAVEDSAWPDV